MSDQVDKTSAVKAAVKSDAGLYEKHKKVYVRAVTGRFNSWRIALVVFTQLLFYGLCWIPWNGRQAVLFEIVERKFYIFGLVLWPQDVIYLSLLLMISAYGLFLFTAIAGRLFCGYACPQTVYTEIFMWIENFIEGDRPARMKLDAQPANARKTALKAMKLAVWLLLALWTSFTFVGYFTPIKDLFHEVKTFSLGPWETFWILFYAGFTILQAGFLREQVCKYMCPYARFQGVMFDPDTLVVTYDPERGEPRGSRKKGADIKPLGLGDCVDCGICVQVCPTGIDIRNGQQYECIGCSACIDGCDEVMDKIGYPRGLIRYSTENALSKHYTKRDIVKHVLRPRVVLYSTILMGITIAAAWSLAVRIPLKVDVIRDRATLAREVEDGLIENVYTLRIINTSEEARSYSLDVTGLKGLSIAGTRTVDVPAASAQNMLVSVRALPESGTKGANLIYFDVKALNQDSISVHEKASFMLP